MKTNETSLSQNTAVTVMYDASMLTRDSYCPHERRWADGGGGLWSTKSIAANEYEEM